MADFLKPGGEFFCFLFKNVNLLGSDAIFYYNETAVRLELTLKKNSPQRGESTGQTFSYIVEKTVWSPGGFVKVVPEAEVCQLWRGPRPFPVHHTDGQAAAQGTCQSLRACAVAHRT